MILLSPKCSVAAIEWMRGFIRCRIAPQLRLLSAAQSIGVLMLDGLQENSCNY